MEGETVSVGLRPPCAVCLAGCKAPECAWGVQMSQHMCLCMCLCVYIR